MHISAFLRGIVEIIFRAVVSDFTNQTHLVQGQLRLPGRGLHDGRQEGLRVEEAREPDRAGEHEVSSPALQLGDPQQEVGVPGGQTVQGGVGQLGPGDGNLNTVCQLAVTEVGLTWSRYKELESSSMSWVIVSSPFSPRSNSLRDLLISAVRLLILSHSYYHKNILRKIRNIKIIFLCLETH